MQKTRVAAVQMNGLLGETARNLATIERFARLAADDQAQLVLFPELCLQGHWVATEVRAKAEEVPDGPSVGKLLSLAKELGVYLSVGMAALCDNAVYNAQVLVGPSGYVGTSCKLHLSGDERLTYRGGDSIPLFDLGFCKVGQIVCYDNSFPEVARVLALKGADVILMPHAGRSGQWSSLEQEKQCVSSIKSLFKADYGCRAKENATFCIVNNQAGCAGTVASLPPVHPWQPHHAGGVIILGPAGQVLAESQTDRVEDEMVVADLDPALLDQARGQHNYTLANRRPELYGEIARPIVAP
jgi:predicted amidohydrolase